MHIHWPIIHIHNKILQYWQRVCECVDLYSAILSGIPDALSALVSHKQVQQMPETAAAAAYRIRLRISDIPYASKIAPYTGGSGAHVTRGS